MTKNVTNSIIFLLISILILSSFFFIFQFGINVPHWDDHAIRIFVDNFSISELFDFHNEHRLAWTRIIAVLSNGLLGELNFKALMYVGQLGLVGLLFTFLPIQKQTKIPFLIIALFIFNASTYENSLWGMAALQNHWVMFFAMLSILVLSNSSFKNSINLYVAGGLSLLAMFTSGNAVLIGPIGLVLLFFKGDKKQIVYWAIFHTLLLFLYFIGFSGGGNVRPNIEEFFLNLFSLSGSFIHPIFDYYYSNKPAYIFGVINLVLSLGVFFRLFVANHDYKKLLAFLGFQAFLIGTLILIAFSRNDYAIETLVSSKYKIYSFLILGTNFFFVFDFLKSKKLKWFLIAFAVFLFFNAQFSFYNSLKETKQSRISDAANLKFAQTDYANSSYNLPILPIEVAMTTLEDPSKIDSVAYDKSDLYFFTKRLSRSSENYILLKSKSKDFILPMFQSRNKAYKGFGKLDLRNFETATYSLFLLENNQDSLKLYDVKKIIKIKGISYNEAKKNW
jgi:hypothetical protein